MQKFTSILLLLANSFLLIASPSFAYNKGIMGIFPLIFFLFEALLLVHIVKTYHNNPINIAKEGREIKYVLISQGILLPITYFIALISSLNGNWCNNELNSDIFINSVLIYPILLVAVAAITLFFNNKRKKDKLNSKKLVEHHLILSIFFFILTWLIFSSTNVQDPSCLEDIKRLNGLSSETYDG